MSIIFCYRRQIKNFFLILSCISGKTLIQELQISLHNNILLRSNIRYGTQSKKIQNVLSFLNVNLTLSFHKLIGHLNAQQALLLKYFGLHEHRRKQGGSRPKSKKLNYFLPFSIILWRWREVQETFLCFLFICLYSDILACSLLFSLIFC